MKVQVIVPTDTVLYRLFPETGISPVVVGAFMHKFELIPQKGKVSVTVRMHVQVQSLKRHCMQKHWKIMVLPCKEEQTADLLLTPAEKGAVATASKLMVHEIRPRDREITLEVCEIAKAPREKPVFSRRQIRAEIESGIRPAHA